MAEPARASETPLGGEDERLLIEAAQSDPRRFGTLYERHFDRVYAFVARRVGDRAEAEDLTADVFHHALAHLGRFEWRGVPFVAWLLRIARNTLADRWQRAARERGQPSPDADDDGSMVDVDRRVLLSDLVGRLPHDQRYVVAERFVEQKSIREIAKALGRTEGAVKQLQFRALETLRDRMRDVHE
jgi:RNA polymerase sigma-70 factor (ECF subfamily)